MLLFYVLGLLYRTLDIGKQTRKAGCRRHDRKTSTPTSPDIRVTACLRMHSAQGRTIDTATTSTPHIHIRRRRGWFLFRLLYIYIYIYIYICTRRYRYYYYWPNLPVNCRWDGSCLGNPCVLTSLLTCNRDIFFYSHWKFRLSHRWHGSAATISRHLVCSNQHIFYCTRTGYCRL